MKILFVVFNFIIWLFYSEQSIILFIYIQYIFKVIDKCTNEIVEKLKRKKEKEKEKENNSCSFKTDLAHFYLFRFKITYTVDIYIFRIIFKLFILII